MRRLFKALAGRLDSAYRNDPYFISRKARLLAAFDLLLLVVVPLNLVKLWWLQPPEMGFRIVFNASIWLAALASFLRVRSGQLRKAGAALVLIAAVPIHILLFLAPHYVEPVSVAVQLVIADFVFVLLALVFASRRIAFLVLGTVVASQVSFYVIALHPQPIAGSLTFTASTVFRDGLIVLAIVFCLGYALDEVLRAAQERSEEALRETRAMNENLERVVADRTRELEAATHRANETSRAKGEFLANMSHEIRTPLNGIIAASELLVSRSDLPPEAGEHARLIAESGDLLLRLIGDVLDLSKIEAGQLEIERQPFELSALIEDCAGLMAPKAAQNGVRIETTLSPGLEGSFLGDGFRLRQIVLNLISNAIKFTPAGGSVQLAISCGHPLLNPKFVRFEVRDTGIGMDEEAKKRLFRRFSQADSSTSRRYGGTGLGLSISFKLVEVMGGKLEVESSPGQGAAFRFTLSLHSIEDSGESAEMAAQTPTRLDLCVLVAEDNATNRKILAAQLERLGCRFAMSTNGAEAIATLRDPLPDAILMDCDMPEIDGWEATRRIRAWAVDAAATPLQRRAAAIPIIALTAATLPEERARCFEVGMNDYLAKPIKIAALQRVLQTVARAKDVTL